MGHTTCNADGCDRPALKMGYCDRDYIRWRKTGNPTFVKHFYRPPEIDPVTWFQMGYVLADENTPSTNGTRCWLWTRGKDAYGYGACAEELGDGSTKAHRVAWLVSGHEIPEGMSIRHDCDVPPCGNVGHLRVGTNRENMADKAARGRAPRGEAHHWAQLTGPQVLGILLRLQGGEPQPSIAARYGITRGMVSHINTGRAWKHYSL